MRLISYCLGLLSIGCVTTLAMDSSRSSSSQDSEPPSVAGDSDDITSVVSDFNHLSMAKHVKPIFGELMQYGIEDMTASEISETERIRRTKDYYKKCDKVSTKLFCRIAVLDDERVKFALLNSQVLGELAKNPARMDEVEESFGEISWLRLAKLCRNLSIPEEGSNNLPRKAILALMVSNDPWKNSSDETYPPHLDLGRIFKDPIGTKYKDAWKYLTPQIIRNASSINIDLWKRIARFIGTPSSTIERDGDWIELCMRILYLENLLKDYYGNIEIQEALRLAMQTFMEAAIPLQASMHERDEKVLVGEWRRIFSRPPLHLSAEHALAIYGSVPLLKGDEAAISEVQADLEAWYALIDSKYMGNLYCKMLMLMRHWWLLSDEIIRDQLNIIMNGQHDALPLSLLAEIVRLPNFSKQPQTMDLLRDCLAAISKKKPLFAIKYALREFIHHLVFSRVILEAASKEDMRQAVLELINNPVSGETVRLSIPDPEEGRFSWIARELYGWTDRRSKKIEFATSKGEILTDHEASDYLLKYLDILFGSNDPRAFIWHSASGGYFPAFELDETFMTILVCLFPRLIAAGRKLPYAISREYWRRMRGSDSHPVTVKDVYGDFMDAGQEIRATRDATTNNYKVCADDIVSAHYWIRTNPLLVALLTGELEDEQDSIRS